MLLVQARDTTLTSKGTITIPAAIRRAAGLSPGSRIAWSFEKGEIRARRRQAGATEAWKHILSYAGTWQGHCSGRELLFRTRP